MDKKYTIVILLVAILALVFSVFTTDNVLTQKLNLNDKAVDKEINNPYYQIKDDHYISRYGKISIDKWDEIDGEKSGFRNAKDFLTIIDNYVNSISEFIMMPDWIERHKEQYREDYYFEPVIEFSFINNIKVASYSDYNMKLSVALNKELFETNYSTLVREITKVIARKSVADSLTEGLAFYVQDELGLNVNKLNYGMDIFTVSKKYVSQNYGSIISRIGLSDGNITLDNQEVFFILSNSFSRYLIQNYGMDKFIEVYKSKSVETAYMEIYGLPVDELKTSWIDYVNNYDNYIKLSKEQISNKKLIKLIGNEKYTVELSGSIKNKAFFILDKSFKEYLIYQFGNYKYDLLIKSNYDYQSTYETSLTELKNLWQQYVNSLD